MESYSNYLSDTYCTFVTYNNFISRVGLLLSYYTLFLLRTLSLSTQLSMSPDLFISKYQSVKNNEYNNQSKN